MAKFNYTPAQNLAITDRGRNILVSAAAGSGKTRVLIDRILRLIIEEQVPIDAMLVVTFTNSAANEMKTRLFQGLNEALESHPNQMAFLRTQVNALSNANVSTMHAFCKKMIKSHFHQLDIEPSFGMVSKSQDIIFQEQAIEEVFEQLYESADEDFLSFVDTFSDPRGDREAMELILECYKFLFGQPNPYQWLEERIVSLESEITDDSSLIKVAINQIQRKFTNIKENIVFALSLCDGFGGPKFYMQALESDLEQTTDAIDAANRSDFDGLIEKIESYKAKALGRAKKTDEGTFDPVVQERIKAIRESGIKNEYKSLKQKYGSFSLDAVQVENRRQATNLRTVKRLIEMFDRAYGEKRKERNLLNFSDLEHMMLRLLENSEVVDEIVGHVRYLFFDEYQDANPMQETIVERLKGEGNLFFVGDVKQAIYRFRGADPSLFNQRYERYASGEDAANVKIDLSENFRSRREILEFSNFVFESTMTKQLGDIDYKMPGQRLVPGLESEPVDEAITVALVEKYDKESSGEPYYSEARFIALEIERLIKKGYSYKDMVVLMRSPRRVLYAYENEFAQREIPYYSDISTVNFQNREVETFITLLSVVDNDRRDRTLMSAMLSVFGDFTEEDLTNIRITDKDNPFFEVVENYGATESNEIAAKINDFYRRLDQLRRRVRIMGLEEFAWHLLDDTRYDVFLLGLKNGNERLANVKAFIEKMGEYEANGSSSLFGFLSYVNQLLGRKGDDLDPAISLSEADDVVRIMSIHKSKGLEFDIVFLAGVSKQFNQQESKNDMVLHHKWGVGIKNISRSESTVYNTLNRQVILTQKINEDRSEEVRLLYVALTRAVERLYLVGEVNDIEQTLNNAISNSLANKIDGGRCYLDWVLAVLGHDVVGKTLGMEIDVTDEVADYYGETHSSIVLIKATRENLAIGEIEEQDTETDGIYFIQEEFMQKIGHQMDFAYPYIEETVKPIKYTVSKLTEMNRVSQDNVRSWAYHPSFTNIPTMDLTIELAPSFMSSSLELDGMALGSLIHRIFQIISLQKHSNVSIDAELNRMVEVDQLTKEEREKVDPQVFQRFFDSSLGQRLVTNANSCERETSFTMKYDGYAVDGQIDCYFIEEGEIVLIDFKTDRRQRPKIYHKQIALYRYALEQALTMKVKESYLYWTNFGTYTSIGEEWEST